MFQIISSEEKTVGKFSDIIERTEQLRNQLGLNKSRFSNRIGMKPQTYNNFLGTQSTKPNIELIYGIIQQFNVNPMWLLKGEGTVFRGDGPPMGGGILPAGPVRGTPEMRESIEQSRLVLGGIQSRMEQDVPEGIPAIYHSIQILKKYFEFDPLYTVHQIKAMLDEFANRAKN